jgi:hypothetical protein
MKKTENRKQGYKNPDHDPTATPFGLWCQCQVAIWTAHNYMAAKRNAIAIFQPLQDNRLLYKFFPLLPRLFGIGRYPAFPQSIDRGTPMNYKER